jgi:hypothetical protein
MDTTPRLLRRRPRRWPWVVLALLLTFVGLPLLSFVAYCWYERRAAENELQAAVERTSQIDPRWRLDQIEADRTVVPDAENAALCVRAARRLLPERWPPRVFGSDWHDGSEAIQLRADQAAALRTELDKYRPALEEARRLKDYTRGRSPLQYAPNVLATLVPHDEEARLVANFLQADAFLRAQDNDPDGALDSCRALLCAGRALGDEPFLITTLVRLGTRVMAVRCANRVLAQGSPSDAALVRLRDLLEDERQDNVLLQGLRGERAVLHDVSLRVEAGELALESLDGKGRPPRGWGRVAKLWVVPRVLRGHAELLEALNEAVEQARLPPEDRGTFFEEFSRRGPTMTWYARLFAPGCGKVGESDTRTHAEMRAALVGLALERYRHKHRRWPDALAALVPEFLPGVPADPYDGAPLRYRRLPDGVVVYCLGPDRSDDGGHLPEPGKTVHSGTDLGFRLWDVDQRRQPPPPFRGPAGEEPPP